MKPVFQTILKPPKGNCLAACIASVLELDIEQVPNFIDNPEDKWYDELLKFLKPFGLYMQDITKKNNGWKPQGYHLISGKSPRYDCLHSVVGYNGKVVHDPYPDWKGESLKDIQFYSIFVATLEEGRKKDESTC